MQTNDALVKGIKTVGTASYIVLKGWAACDDVEKCNGSADVESVFGRRDCVRKVGNSKEEIRQYIRCGKPVARTSGGGEFIA